MLSFHIILQIFQATPIKSFKVYFLFFISVFAIFSINNLNVCHRNFDVNKNHFNCKSFTTDILDIKSIRYNCGEMAQITYAHFYQHYSKYIFRNSMSHNLQRAKENGDNIKFYWINFITSLLFLCKQFYHPKLKVIVIISRLIHLVISYNALTLSVNSVSVIINLKNSPPKEYFTIEVLRTTYKINKFPTNMHFKLISISKVKCKGNHLYLKMPLLLSGDINLNPGPATIHQLNDPKFEAFNNKGLQLIHLNINIDELEQNRWIMQCC